MLMPLLTSNLHRKRKPDFNDSPRPLKGSKSDYPTQNDGIAESSKLNLNPHGITFWNAQWRAPQYKKHKTWDGDAILAMTPSNGSGTWCILYDGEGRIVTKAKLPLLAVKKGDYFKIGEKEYEIDFQITQADFHSGVYFSGNTSAQLAPLEPLSGTLLNPTKVANMKRPFIPVRPRATIPPRGIPLQPVNLTQDMVPNRCNTKDAITNLSENVYWAINWNKSSTVNKKKKAWENDGYLFFEQDSVSLFSDSGQSLGKSTWKGPQPHTGLECYLCGKEIRLDTPVAVEALPFTVKENQPENIQIPESLKTLAPQSKKFTPPTPMHSLTSLQLKELVPHRRLSNADAEGAILMKNPHKSCQTKYNPRNYPVVSVVIDPLIARFLRPHQIEGVKFMYECVMGMRKHEGEGCILADEMGMGKTLQTITLVWTLLKQSPYGGNSTVGKCLIACPVSLVRNWKKEFHKWLGQDRIGVFVGDTDKTQIKQFLNSKIHQVLVIGYERLKTVIADLTFCQPPIGLIICDEGHRLKSAHSKVNQMFDVLNIRRRIILSGTPIQNNLEELHAMADFCNPGLLDDYTSFKRLYEIPILKSRTPGCSSKDAQLGNERSTQLLDVCNSFVLRRDASILVNFLPPKFEYIVFMKSSDLQLSLYGRLLDRNSLRGLIEGPMARSLTLMHHLIKISNSPLLLRVNEDENGETNGTRTSHLEAALDLLPKGGRLDDFSLSGKFTLLANILQQIRESTEEKCIIVSHYTSALNAIQTFCQKKHYSYVRLDGRVPANKRQALVDAFNKSSQKESFLFLLSAKAGGVGLNLIGASRLILVDSDWNPSHDLQAMARIHRDGQKRPVYIYRLLTAGTIDEKIFQRQVTKMGLSDSLMTYSANARGKTDSFTPEELRDLFTVQTRTPCHTHDLLGCKCLNHSAQSDQISEYLEDEGAESISKGWTLASQLTSGELEQKPLLRKCGVELASLGEWSHIDCTEPFASGRVRDEILSQLMARNTHSISVLPNEEQPGWGSPYSRAHVLLDDFDSHCKLTETNDGVDMSNIEGGQITFIFEKKSDSVEVTR